MDELYDFLVYSYFGIVPENIFLREHHIRKKYGKNYKTYCTKRVIIVAYGDATNQGAYNALFSKKLKNREKLVDKSKTARKSSALFLFDKIGELNEITDYEQWHCSTCKGIVDLYKSVKNEETAFFTYGNAQKWVNMTMKYLLMLDLLPDNIRENDLHIPVDSFIIDALWDDKSIALPCDNTDTRNRSYKHPSDHVCGWSQWTKKQYGNFRKSISGSDYSLWWENKAWITQSERRKESDSNNRFLDFFDEANEAMTIYDEIIALTPNPISWRGDHSVAEYARAIADAYVDLAKKQQLLELLKDNTESKEDALLVNRFISALQDAVTPLENKSLQHFVFSVEPYSTEKISDSFQANSLCEVKKFIMEHCNTEYAGHNFYWKIELCRRNSAHGHGSCSESKYTYFASPNGDIRFYQKNTYENEEEKRDEWINDCFYLSQSLML